MRVVFSGHEHTYERVKPQQGIYYFVLGNSGQLRLHNLRKSPNTEKGFDTDRGFGLVEIAGGEFWFQIVSRTGETVDSGMYPLALVQKAKAADWLADCSERERHAIRNRTKDQCRAEGTMGYR